MRKIVLIRGSGDVGSAVAHVLYQAGFKVAIHEVASPTCTRRGMAFADAIFDGHAHLDGVVAKKTLLSHLPEMLSSGRAIPVTVDGLGAVLRALPPDVLVDARMAKHAIPEQQIELAPMTIGLGPNFVAGQTTHVAIETAWGSRLGSLVTSGATLPMQGEPRIIGGAARERFSYATCDGAFRTDRAIGDPVQRGDAVGTIADSVTVLAPLNGVLRGLLRSGIVAKRGMRVLEVDPRQDGAVVSGIGERPRIIAESVLSLLS